MKPPKPHKSSCFVHRVYHLTCDEMAALEADCFNGCAICGTDRPLEIDHDHSVGCKAVRGRLCHSCNIILGLVEDNRRLPTSDMVRYLSRPWYRRQGMTGECPTACPNSVFWRSKAIGPSRWRQMKARNWRAAA